MSIPTPSILDRALAALPGWLLLMGGMALVAMALLVPPSLAVRELNWERDVMRFQADRVSRERERYQAFHAALVADDPVLLERLAYAQLHYKPRGKQPLVSAGGLAAGPGQTLDDRRAAAGLIEAWLDVPMPRVGEDLPPYAPPDTRMVRLATGQSRFGLLAAGLICGLAGVWWPVRTDADATAQRRG